MAHLQLNTPLSRLLQPSFVLDYDGAVGPQADGIQLQCWLDGIDPTVSEGGVAQTFCNQFERVWNLSMKMTWELHTALRPLQNKKVKAATLRDATAAISADNIEESFELEVPSFPSAIAGGVRSITPVTMAFTQVGDSVFADTDAAKATTHPT